MRGLILAAVLALSGCGRTYLDSGLDAQREEWFQAEANLLRALEAYCGPIEGRDPICQVDLPQGFGRERDVDFTARQMAADSSLTN